MEYLLSPLSVTNRIILTATAFPPTHASFSRIKFFSPYLSSRLHSHRWTSLKTHTFSFKRTVSPKAYQQVVGENEEEEDCEMVNGVKISIGDGSESISAYLLKAVKNNNGAGILLLSDIYGFEDSSIKDFAYRVACNGYNVLVPDLFGGNPWRKNLPEEGLSKWMEEQEKVASEIASSGRSIADLLGSDDGVSGKLGIIGICFGGKKAIELLSEEIGGLFSVGVWLYGTKMEEKLGDGVKTPMLFICGDSDSQCSVGGIEEMGRKIEGSRVVVFEGRGHDFVHRPGSPEEDEDAEKAFGIMRNWLHDGLLLHKL